MPITIDATPGGATANAFVSLAEMEAYMASRLNASVWDAADDDTKNRAIAEATRELSARRWMGERTTNTQALSWPRAWAVNPDDPWRGYYASDVIPQRVKDATCEVAFQFVKAGTTDLAVYDDTLAIKRKKVDVLETEYVDPYQRVTGLARFPRVLALIEPLVYDAGNSVEVVRG